MDQERRTAVASTQRLAPEDIATRAFSSSFRGLSESEVRSFLKRIAEELTAAQVREHELREELDIVRARADRREPLDESELLEALGEETAKLLRSAREAARDIRQKAEDISRQTRDDANADAERVRAEAAGVLDEQRALAQAETDAASARAIEAADAQRSEANTEAEAIRDAAIAQGRSMVDEAKGVRERIVADLGHRRTLLQAQIGELRAGREHLLDAYRVVKTSFLAATDALASVETKAAEHRPEPVDPSDLAAVLNPANEAILVGLADDLSDPEVAVSGPVVSGALADDDETRTVDAGTVDAVAVDAGTIDAAHEPAVLDATADSTDAVDDAVGPETPDVAAQRGASSESSPAMTSREPDSVDVSDDAQPKVGDLFARIRAQADVAQGDVAQGDAAQGDAEPTLNDVPKAVDTSATVVAEPVGGEAAVESAVEAADLEIELEIDEPVDVAGAGPSPEAPKPSVVMMQAVGAIHAAAAKKVKRASQDEQNELLDALRRQKGRLTSVAVVPTAEAHSLAWAGVLRTCLDEAHVAGSRLSETSTTSGRSGGPLLVCPDAVVKELVVAVVGGLRERIVLAIDSGEADSATDRVNARYREWKSQQLDALLTDALVAAFVSGAFAMIPAGSTLQWVEADGGCCSECADNTLESVLKGAEFPTGHALPPAHPACRCAVVVLAN